VYPSKSTPAETVVEDRDDMQTTILLDFMFMAEISTLHPSSHILILALVS